MRKGYVLLLVLTAAICATSLQGCKKKKDKKAVTIVNRLDMEITFDLYGSAEDYATNSNLLQRIVVGAKENKTIPGSNFVDGAIYYMDWYSADYYYNNWYNDNFPVTSDRRVRIKPEEGDNTYYLETSYKGSGRNAFLKGGGTQSSWIAVRAYLFNNTTGYSDQWNNIKADERYRQVVVKKNFMAEYTHKDATGAIVKEDMEFMVQQADVPYIEFKPANGSTGSMVGGKLPVAAPPDYKSNSTDTVMALFPDHEYYFMMVRQ